MPTHLELFVEEPSMEAFIKSWLPRNLADGDTFSVAVFNGKQDLLKKVPARLLGYKEWLPENYRLFILIDKDDDDCHELKSALELACVSSGFATRASAPQWVASTCIVIEELEAWYFGEWSAVVAAFPGVSPNVPHKARYRNSDQIVGGTWEALERLLQKHGYFTGGLQKIAAARAIGENFSSVRCTSGSFQHFLGALHDATAL
jgi:hypothetical protein